MAVRLIDTLIGYCESLSQFPLRGTRRDDLLPGLRTTPYRRTTVIACVVNAGHPAVSILGVFDGGQSYAGLRQPWDD